MPSYFLIPKRGPQLLLRMRNKWTGSKHAHCQLMMWGGVQVFEKNRLTSREAWCQNKNNKKQLPVSKRILAHLRPTSCCKLCMACHMRIAAYFYPTNGRQNHSVNSLNAKCIYTCILTQPYNHLCDACQCCVCYKESLWIPCCTFTYMQFSDMHVNQPCRSEVKPRRGSGV